MAQSIKKRRPFHFLAAVKRHTSTEVGKRGLCLYVCIQTEDFTLNFAEKLLRSR